MLLCYVMYVMSSTNLLPCDRGFTSVLYGIHFSTIGDGLLVRWYRTLSPLGTYSQSVGNVLEL